MKSWIVGLTERIFYLLSWISLHKILKNIFKFLSTPGGIEIWVLFHVVLSIFATLNSISYPEGLLTRILMWYGAFRVFEIIIYQINVLLFDQLRAHKKNVEYILEGYTRIILLIIQNCVEITLWFSTAISYYIPAVGNIKRTFLELIVNSFSNFTGFGPSSIMPETLQAMAWIWAESATGLFMSIIILARFISILPIPKSKAANEKIDL